MFLFGTEILIQLGEIVREHDENEELDLGWGQICTFQTNYW